MADYIAWICKRPDSVASGQTPAEDLLALYHGKWGRKVEPVFEELAY